MGKFGKEDGQLWDHQRFTIKCLKSEVIPVSIRLKTIIKTSKGLQIIRRAEKQLLNEHIRSINNTLELLMVKRDTCIKEFKDTIQDNEAAGQKTFEECGSFIKRVRECRHNKVMQRQKLKYEALQQKKIGCSNKGKKNRYMYKHRSHNRRDEKVGEEPIKHTINCRSREAFGPGAKICHQAKETSCWRIHSGS